MADGEHSLELPAASRRRFATDRRLNAADSADWLHYNQGKPNIACIEEVKVGISAKNLRSQKLYVCVGLSLTLACTFFCART